MVMTSASESSGEGPRWRSFLPLSQSSVRQKTAMMKVLRSTVGDLLCVFGGLDTTEHSGGLVLLSTSQGNLHTGLATRPSSKEREDRLRRALVYGRSGFSPEQRRDLIGDRADDLLVAEYLIFYVLEGAFVLLPEDARRQTAPLLLQERRGDARYLGGADSVALPGAHPSFASPFLKEHAALAPGRREHDQRSTRDGEHRTHGEVEPVVHPRGLVYYKQGRSAEAPDGHLCA